MRSFDVHRSAILIPFLGLTSLSAQVDWRPLDVAAPAGRVAHAAAWDLARDRLVLFGGQSEQALDDTWEWDGQRWFRYEPAIAPVRRVNSAMAYDPVRRRTVLFGGESGLVVLGDTWEWDGSTWAPVATPNAPSPRVGHSLTWDPVRQRLVLVGGRETGGVPSSETWEFDGVDWTIRVSATVPPARAFHGAAFDESRGVLVTYGGGSVLGTYFDTWEWDGSNWSVHPAGSRFPLSAPLAYDAVRQRVVLYGGHSGGLTPASEETWEWDGVSWTPVSTPATAGPRNRHALVFDSSRARVLAIGGSTTDPSRFTSSVAAFDGSTWEMVESATDLRIDHRLVWDGRSGRPLSFGGRPGLFGRSDRTHTFDGSSWVREQPRTSPPARLGQGTAFDRRRGRVVLFGGDLHEDTWEWDGSNWTEIHTTNSPAQRSVPAMVFDERRERIVLFGGEPSLFTPYADTWEYDGVDWSLVTTSGSPGPRTRHAMAYDAGRGVSVTFGGYRSGAAMDPVDETWEYDGLDWRRATETHRPAARTGHDMVFDPVRSRVVLFGGETVQGPNTETWEWDGVDWVQIVTTMRPRFGRLVFDEGQARTLLFADGAEVWEYATAAPPELTPYGTGCAGALGVPELVNAVLEYPVLGRSLDLHVQRSRPAWPVVLMVGLSRTKWIGGSLPLDLTPVGASGCWLLQSDEDHGTDIADASGRAVFTLQVPSATTLLGGQVWCQAFVVDATSNPLGWVASPGLGLTVGW